MKRIKLKVLKLESYMIPEDDDKEDFSDFGYIKEIKPIYLKPNWYYGFHPEYKERIAWWEVNDRAFTSTGDSNLTDSFLYMLELLMHKPIRDEEYEALLVLEKCKRYDLFSVEALKIETEIREREKDRKQNFKNLIYFK